MSQVWLDPGYEFAKPAADNVRMLLDTPALLALGRPVVVSASRKGFLAELLGSPKLPSSAVQSVAGLAEATLAFNTLAAWLGVHIVRVHDVASRRRTPCASSMPCGLNSPCGRGVGASGDLGESPPPDTRLRP